MIFREYFIKLDKVLKSKRKGVLILFSIIILSACNISHGNSQTSYKLWRLVKSSHESNLDIVFLPAGYDCDELVSFNNTVYTFYNRLLSIEPFLRYRDYINMWRIDTAIDFELKRHPENNLFLTINSLKCKSFVESIIELDLDLYPPDDMIVVIADSSIHGGSGSADIAVTYSGKYGFEVMIHEIGHSFGVLGDEYVVKDEDYPIGGEVSYPNIDLNGSKWKDVPGTSVFPGAWYRNLVRPTYDSCIMRTLEYLGFCPVCLKRLVSLLEKFKENKSVIQ